jgi:hypothetical protein
MDKKIIQEIQKITLPKNQEADTGKYTYRYTSLDDLHAQIKPILYKHDVIVNYVMDGSNIALQLDNKTVSSLDLSLMMGGSMSPAQQMGSAITYARRYLLVAYFDLLADEDIDGASPEQLKDRENVQEYTIKYPNVQNPKEERTYIHKEVTLKSGEKKKIFELKGGERKDTAWEGTANYDGIALQIKHQLT